MTSPDLFPAYWDLACDMNRDTQRVYQSLIRFLAPRHLPNG